MATLGLQCDTMASSQTPTVGAGSSQREDSPTHLPPPSAPDGIPSVCSDVACRVVVIIMLRCDLCLSALRF